MALWSWITSIQVWMWTALSPGDPGTNIRQTSPRFWKYHSIWEGPFSLEKLTLETGDPPMETSAYAQRAAWRNSIGGRTKNLIKSYSSRDTINDARNPHYETGSSIHFQDGPETYSNFKYLQELWVFIEKWHHQSTEAKKQGAFKENWKNNFVSLHAMSSAQRK